MQHEIDKTIESLPNKRRWVQKTAQEIFAAGATYATKCESLRMMIILSPPRP